MEYIVIGLCVAILAALVVLIVVFAKKKPASETPANNQISELQLGVLSEKIDSMKTSLNKDIEIAIKKEMLVLKDAEKAQSELDNQKLERFQKSINESINTRFDQITKNMNSNILEMNKKVDEKLQEGFKGTSETMAQVRERLQAIDDAQKNLEGISKEVVSLKQVLEGNQTRGQYGEFQLEMVLNQIFGDTVGCYELQYTMKKVKDGDDVRADAVVFLPEPNKMICVDSKFPFQDYTRVFEAESEEEKEQCIKDFSNAVKKHITAINNKYIVDGKTAKQAFMFIPNDGVFAFIHHYCLDAVDYAREKNVILSSPSTLPAMLSTINMIRIEAKRAESAKIITQHIAKLSKNFEMLGREWVQLNGAIDKIQKSSAAFDNRVNKITGKFEEIKMSDVNVNNEVKQIEASEDGEIEVI